MTLTILPKEKVKQPVEIKRNPVSMELHVCWSIWNTCNYRCSYCPPYNHEANNKWLTKKHVISVIDQIYEHYVHKMGLRKLQISFTGGEPTLFKGFKEICHYIRERDITLGLTTNASAGIRFWRDFAHLFDWMSFSYHPELVDSEKFFDLLAYLHDRPDVCLPAVRLMMHPEERYWQQCIAFGKRIKESLDNWVVEYVELQSDFGEGLPETFYVDEKQKQFLLENNFDCSYKRKAMIKPAKYGHDQQVFYDNGESEQLHTNELVNKKLVNFYGWECDVGLESLFINYEGEIYRAGCREGGVLGHVKQDRPIAFPERPIICQSEWCFCGTNIMVSKRKRRQN